MPVRRPVQPLRIRPRRDPITGREIAPPRTAPEKDVPDNIAFHAFAVMDRQQALSERLQERGRIATSRMQNEYQQWAYNMDAHPLRRLRLQYRKGPLSVEDTSVLTGVPERTIKRIEAHEKTVGALAYQALAAGLEVRLDQVWPEYVKGF